VADLIPLSFPPFLRSGVPLRLRRARPPSPPFSFFSPLRSPICQTPVNGGGFRRLAVAFFFNTVMDGFPEAALGSGVCPPPFFPFSFPLFGDCSSSRNRKSTAALSLFFFSREGPAKYPHLEIARGEGKVVVRKDCHCPFLLDTGQKDSSRIRSR